MSHILLGVCLALLSSCLGALAHAFGKRALDAGLSIPTFLLVRSITGAACTCMIYATLAARLGWPTITPSAIVLGTAVGICHPVLSNLFYFGGLKGGDLSVMSPLINTSPLFAAVLAAILLGEEQTTASALALVVILIGAVAVPLSGAAPTHQSSGSHSTRRSAALGLGSALSIALYLVIGKQAMKTTDTRVVVLVLNLVGCLAFSALAAADRTVKRPAVRPTGSLRGAILFTVGSGVLVYAMCSFLTLSAVNLIGASLTSCFASSNVLFGMVFSVMVIGERPSKRRYVGAVLVAVGCALSALSRKPM